jgi:hypothetical protein
MGFGAMTGMLVVADESHERPMPLRLNRGRGPPSST